MATRGNQDVKKLGTGMNTDTSPINQPPNTYRYALNMMLESREGDHTNLINEEGNVACAPLKSGYLLIGSILISNNETILFSTNGTKSEIGILSQSCVYTPLIESTCLNFSRDFPVTGVYKIHNGCDRIIYFTDNYNPIRRINLDNLLQYVNPTSSSVAIANSTDDWNCTMFKLNPDFDIPTVALGSVQDGGGNLQRGTYMFTIRYLDDDFNPTNWTDLTQIVPIYENSTTNYNSVDGGNTDLTGNELFNAGKAIQLDISNLDIDFPYYQLGVIEVTDGPINEGAAYSLTEEPITGTTATYLYTGASDQETVESLEELVVDNIVFNKVKTLAQIDNRLILGNTTDDLKEWADFQRAASQIHLSWGTTSQNKSTVTGDNAKNPEYMFYRRSYMRDEIYAFGVVYVFNDGTTSPVFHIPGRPKDEGYNAGAVVTNANMVAAGNTDNHSRNTVPGGSGWDTQLLTVIANPATTTGVAGGTQVFEDDVKHIPITEFTVPSGARVGNTIERWKVYNTAITNAGGQGRHFAYTECDTVYPDIQDCSGTSVWGTDLWGTSLAGTPIRHHKFPDATLTTHHDGNEATPVVATLSSMPTPNGGIYPVYVSMDNVTIPAAYASEVQGYYLVRSVRTPENKTVLDKGYIGHTLSITPLYGPGSTAWAPTNLYGIQSKLFTSTFPRIFHSPKTQFTSDIQDVGYFKIEHGNAAVNIGSGNDFYQVLTGTQVLAPRGAMHNRSPEGYVYVDEDSRQETFAPFTNALENRHVGTRRYFTQWDSVVSNELYNAGAGQMYAAAKVWRKPYANLFNIQYINTGEMITGGGPDFIYGGDTMISEFTWQDISKANSGNYLNMPRVANGNFYVESDYNVEARARGTQGYETHLRLNDTIINFLNIDQYPDDPDKDFALNYFRYDEMYSQEPLFKTYAPLPLNWDYCNECPDSFPYRLWYSERAYQETRRDNYTEFLANNYQDILGASGDITNLFVYRDQLYAQTDYATWFISTRPQTMTTNEGNVEIGTGDIFSIPPKRIESVDRGYAGNQHMLTTVVTEFGTFWVDADAGKVFLMTGKGPKDVTLKGMRNWFAENLPFNVLEALPDFDVDSHTSKNGVGLQAYLDPRHNRMVLHKRDYLLIGAASTIDSYETYVDPSPNTYGYNSTTGEYYSWSGSEVILDLFADPTLYEDKSWTISFSLMGENWDSFHSYMPLWGFTNRNNFYTFNEGSDNLWKHGTRGYCNFYGENKPSVVDFIYNKGPVMTKVYNSLQYISKAEDFINGSFVEIPYETYDNFWVYNTSQSSGLLDISTKQTFANPFVEVNTPTHTEAYVTNNENTFSVSEFYDMTINKTDPIKTSDWSVADYQTARLDYGILDYPNPTPVDFNKSPFEIEPMRDKWLGVRLWYNNDNNYKLTTEFVSSDSNISFK